MPNLVESFYQIEGYHARATKSVVIKLDDIGDVDKMMNGQVFFAETNLRSFDDVLDVSVNYF